MSNYSKGRALEYEIMKIFRDVGWDVIRGSSSKGDVFGMKIDLIASREKTKYKDTAYIVLIQAKRNKVKK